MKLVIENVQYHRNGICGAPFHALIFRDPDEGRMLGVVFDHAHHVAVFNLDKLTLGNIAFGVNSWRGDRYEPHLRNAIRKHQRAKKATTTRSFKPDYSSIDLDELLEQRRQIAVVWCIDDVLEVRPDLSGDQAWKVLQRCEDKHDCESGFTWDFISDVAEDLFPSTAISNQENQHAE